MANIKLEGGGLLTIPNDELVRWIESRMPPGMFYTFERVKINNTTQDLEARYTYSNQGAPEAPKPE